MSGNTKPPEEVQGQDPGAAAMKMQKHADAQAEADLKAKLEAAASGNVAGNAADEQKQDEPVVVEARIEIDPEDVIGTIESWTIRHNHVYGYIYDDKRKRFENGQQIRTSPIKARVGDYVVTENSVYKLGRKFPANHAG